ncbi:MAG: phage portal protein, partial [Planctomycetota bacterium]
MTMLNWLSSLLPTRKRPQNRTRTLVRARYDAAVTNEDNRRHWANADGLSANSANSAEVRRILRNRSRYEVANNSYARGIVLTLANDTIGTGPRLQMLTEDAEANRRIERQFHLWSKAVG